MDKIKNISGWGNYPSQNEAFLYPVDKLPEEIFTIRGNGRSYGDAAIGKRMVSSLSLTKEISLDKENGILTCDSGFLLRDILNYIVPLGYTITTIPGTQFVTIGGMIAADVHGKNHFKHGSIGNWVKELLIKIDDNNTVWCSVTENPALFKATIGGIGLTGIILKAKIKLTPIKSCLFNHKTTSAKSISELIHLFNQCSDDYQVAWLDLLNNNPKFLFFSGNESNINDLALFNLKTPKISIPPLPFKLLSNSLMKFYNNYYYKKNRHNTTKKNDFNEFFFPLDKYNHWNRLYGKKGMIQYQFILPEPKSVEGMNEIIELIQKSSYKPYLSVLKKYKENTSPGLLSFPMKGYSMALDFPYQTGLVSFLNQLDQKVIKYKGRIYLAKDACLESKNIEKMYPNLVNFKSEIANYKYSSNLATRLNLK